MQAMPTEGSTKVKKKLEAPQQLNLAKKIVHRNNDTFFVYCQDCTLTNECKVACSGFVKITFLTFVHLNSQPYSYIKISSWK